MERDDLAEWHGPREEVRRKVSEVSEGRRA
jgi:hypothetical protein